MRKLGTAAAILLILSSTTGRSRGAEETKPTIDDTAEAGDADAVPPATTPIDKWNTADWGFSTFRFGFGFLVDYADYGQDDASKEQLTLDTGDVGVRDFRLLFKG